MYKEPNDFILRVAWKPAPLFQNLEYDFGWYKNIFENYLNEISHLSSYFSFYLFVFYLYEYFT